MTQQLSADYQYFMTRVSSGTDGILVNPTDYRVIVGATAGMTAGMTGFNFKRTSELTPREAYAFIRSSFQMVTSFSNQQSREILDALMGNFCSTTGCKVYFYPTSGHVYVRKTVNGVASIIPYLNTYSGVDETVTVSNITPNFEIKMTTEESASPKYYFTRVKNRYILLYIPAVNVGSFPKFEIYLNPIPENVDSDIYENKTLERLSKYCSILSNSNFCSCYSGSVDNVSYTNIAAVNACWNRSSGIRAGTFQQHTEGLYIPVSGAPAGVPPIPPTTPPGAPSSTGTPSSTGAPSSTGTPSSTGSPFGAGIPTMPGLRSPEDILKEWRDQETASRLAKEEKEAKEKKEKEEKEAKEKKEKEEKEAKEKKEKEEKEKKEKEERDKQSSRTKWIIGIVAVILILILVGGGVFFMMKSKKGTPEMSTAPPTAVVAPIAAPVIEVKK